MGKELFNELTKINEIDLIYVNKKQNKDKINVTYNIICNFSSVTENIDVCKKIVAAMEVIKTLMGNETVNFSYIIKTSAALDEDIISRNRHVIDNLLNANIVYRRNNYFIDLVNANKNYRSR